MMDLWQTPGQDGMTEICQEQQTPKPQTAGTDQLMVAALIDSQNDHKILRIKVW